MQTPDELRRAEIDEWYQRELREKLTHKYQTWIGGELHTSSNRASGGLSGYYIHVPLVRELVELRIDGVAVLSEQGAREETDDLPTQAQHDAMLAFMNAVADKYEQAVQEGIPFTLPAYKDVAFELREGRVPRVVLTSDSADCVSPEEASRAESFLEEALKESANSVEDDSEPSV